MRLGTNDIGSVYLGTNAVQSVYLGSNLVYSAFSSGLLDSYSGAAAAYSLRRLSIAYTGSAIRVRRASDNTEQDIGFVGEDLNTSALTTFCSGTNGFVKTWYDQSGNGYDATQTTAANQPQIVSSGSVINVNSKPSLSFDSINDNLNILNSASNLKFLHSDLSTIITVNRTNTTSGNALLGSNRGTGSNVGFYLYGTTNLQHVISSGSANISINTSTTTISSNVQYLNFVIGDPANATLNQRSSIFINNSTVNQNNVNSGTLSTNNSVGDVQIGALGGNAERLNGNYQELIIYASSQSSNRTGIQTNINTYYSIY